MHDLFISYSRKDSDFVRSLYSHLTASDLEVWVDWEDIPPTLDWWETIKKGIEESNALVFIITPNALASPICHLEIHHALSNNKRLIPIIRQEFDEQRELAELIIKSVEQDVETRLGEDNIMAIARTNYREITRHNWVFLQGETLREEDVKNLIASIKTDYGYINQHTQLLIRARAWETRAHATGLLLRGLELKEAQIWMNNAKQMERDPKSSNIAPTALQIDYIQRSQKHASRRFRFQTVGGALLSLIGFVIGGVIIWQVVQLIQRIEPMTGTFNIAIAPVYEVRGGETETNDHTAILTGKIYDAISKDKDNIPGFTENAEVQVQRFDVDPVTDAAAAEAIIDDYNAHIVVYGVLDATAKTFAPRFHLSSKYVGVSEITGESAFGAPIADFPLVISDNPDAEIQLVEGGFTERIGLLAQFLYGIGAYRLEYYDVALDKFNQVNQQWCDEETEDCESEAAGKGILYLWMGTLFDRSYSPTTPPDEALVCPWQDVPTETAIPALDCAMFAYQLAANSEDTFARGNLGISNVYYSWAWSLAMPICSLFIDNAIPPLEKIITLDESGDPTATLTNVKAFYGIGTNYRSFAECNRFGDNTAPLEAARDAFQTATELANKLETNEEIAELTARSWYQLGFVYASLGQYGNANSAYQSAIQVTQPPEDDLERESSWKEIRWYAAVRRAHLHLITADTTPDGLQQVIEETGPVIDAYNAHYFEDPQFAFDALRYRGQAYAELNEIPQACDAYQQALAIGKQSPNLNSIDAVTAQIESLEGCDLVE